MRLLIALSFGLMAGVSAVRGQNLPADTALHPRTFSGSLFPSIAPGRLPGLRDYPALPGEFGLDGTGMVIAVGPGVGVLDPDHMPCLVPDPALLERMPVLRTFSGDPMPNGVKMRRLRRRGNEDRMGH